MLTRRFSIVDCTTNQPREKAHEIILHNLLLRFSVCWHLRRRRRLLLLNTATVGSSGAQQEPLAFVQVGSFVSIIWPMFRPSQRSSCVRFGSLARLVFCAATANAAIAASPLAEPPSCSRRRQTKNNGLLSTSIIIAQEPDASLLLMHLVSLII